MMKRPAPALLAVQYEVIDSWRATMALRGHCPNIQEITVAHDFQTGMDDYRINGDGCLSVISLSNGDILTLLVRDDDGTPFACGTYEVRITLSETQGIILVPMNVSQLTLYQCDETVPRQKVERCLESAVA